MSPIRASIRSAMSARAMCSIDGAERIETELADQPRVKAKLLDTLATAYRYIGEPRRASICLSEGGAAASGSARERAARRGRDAQPARGQLRQQRLLAQGRRDRRTTLAGAAREERRRRARTSADSYNTIGVVLQTEDRLDEAEVGAAEGPWIASRQRRRREHDCVLVAQPRQCRVGSPANSTRLSPTFARRSTFARRRSANARRNTSTR